MSLAGQQIGPYRLLKLIKHGNKSEAYQAEDTSQSQPVVITVISLDAMFLLRAIKFRLSAKNGA
ncbi:hypothetical protein [Dictyobacter formicarum]|uniref:Uncharacterized protein n=1 Tax=Dictyobacter formicarum TaxID=2778368 RepID=A0ABQ3VQT4_9CHLR|nr:hypothetical protein [Dictyobacter formicarum]GHO87686.1 hypothetical protein KSZ_56920 [Dictyobacter formicarum]